MLKKIKKIKKLLIFNDYSWDNNLPEFKQYNLIYGWNGSGKTTLTYLFAALEKGTSEKFLYLEYQIKTESGSIRQREASTLKSCAILGRNGHGIELVKKYIELSKKRLKNEVPEKLLKNRLKN